MLCVRACVCADREWLTSAFAHKWIASTLPLSPLRAFLSCQVWDVETWEEKKNFMLEGNRDAGYIEEIIFHPDGQRLISVGHDNCVSIIDVRACVCVCVSLPVYGDVTLTSYGDVTLTSFSPYSPWLFLSALPLVASD